MGISKCVTAEWAGRIGAYSAAEWADSGGAAGIRQAPLLLVRPEMGFAERQSLLKGMAEVAIAAASFLQKRYSGKRGPQWSWGTSQKFLIE
jgi:hypothetical protein